jgi:hypothetical protein
MHKAAITSIIATDLAICALVAGATISEDTAFVEAEMCRAALAVIFAFDAGILLTDQAIRAIFIFEAACAN